MTSKMNLSEGMIRLFNIPILIRGKLGLYSPTLDLCWQDVFFSLGISEFHPLAVHIKSHPLILPKSQVCAILLRYAAASWPCTRRLAGSSTGEKRSLRRGVAVSCDGSWKCSRSSSWQRYLLLCLARIAHSLFEDTCQVDGCPIFS